MFFLYCFYEPEVAKDPMVETLAEGGYGNFVRALWIELMKSDLYQKAAVACHRWEPQDLSQCRTLGRMAMDFFYSARWLDAVFGETETCPICLLVMHRLVKTHSDLPVPLSPLPPSPVSSPQPMSPADSVAELPELCFEKCVAESTELSFAKSVAKSLEPCSTEPSVASSRLGSSGVKPTVVSVVLR
ncbi:hypothetical protein NPIL_434401 [Nephila pilipes]|uniref:Uncharacterized protein n=1 Tax=Nephila pilipes TaxID=299642 RepID=A0A8X6QGI3_NEPPI|nr:hypothetical protein NPIL_391971 [Nephila pilipes]GFU12926.1 hypothetical protein NPIL_434401 [Nephila pilipes]